MAQKTSVIKIASHLIKPSNIYNRLLHNGGAGASANVHNAESVIGLVADNMERSKCKLPGEDESKISPNTDLLKQLPKTGDASASTEKEEGNTNVMPDPNTSMWNMCKETNETAGKKLKMKFKKLKDNIKNYYLERLEENQILFTEVEEPFKIGKLDKKDHRSSKFREGQEEMESMVEEVQPPMMRPAMRERMNLMNQNQTKVEENLEAHPTEENINDEIMQEQVPQPHRVGYRQFNRSAYKNRSSEDHVEQQDMETRNQRVTAKNANLETSRNERYSEPEQSSMWKRPQVKSEKVKERGNGGLSDIRGMSPAIYFKAGGLVNKYRNLFSVVAADHAFQRSFSTCTQHLADSGCRPPPLPPQTTVCEPGVKLPKCPKPEGFAWPCCPKITLCGCEPPNPRVYKLNCGKEVKRALFPYAKRPDYMCPSFSECKRNTELIEKRPSECCWYKKTCDMFVGPRKPFVTALERQEISLGQRYWTAKKIQKCWYHFSARRFAQNNDKEDCNNKDNKGLLPCHRPGRKSHAADGNKTKGTCEKICMPCCEPAKVPPSCDDLSTYQKTECTRIENPRPSFSECKKMFAMKQVRCECEVETKPRCPEKKTKDETC